MIIGEPCTVQSIKQMKTVAQKLSHAPVQALRGGVYKPGTSPEVFGRMGEEK